MGTPYEIQCEVHTNQTVHSDIVIISWSGPDNKTVTTDERMTVTKTTTVGTNHTSTLHFSYLSEEDKGVFNCHVTVLTIIDSDSFEVEDVISK